MDKIISFPASDDRVIAVGATDISGNRAGFSDFGSELDLVAPGVNILSTFVRNRDWNPNSLCGDTFGSEGQVGYGTCTGTSMSSPHITGLVALIRSVDPLLNRIDVKNILISSSSEYPVKDPELGYGITDAALAVEKALGSVNGTVLDNRLTPLFSFYSAAAQDSFYTTVPQMAMAAYKGTILPQPTQSSVNFLPNYGSATPFYTAFPDEPGDGFGPPLPTPSPKAEVYIFTTEKNPINQNQPLVPLYRMSYQGTNVNNTLNLDHFYTTEQTGVTSAENVGYIKDGIEGYIFSSYLPQPVGTVKLHRRYNPTRDDHAIFPDTQLNQMIANGYTWLSGNDVIGYVYLNQDTDNDYLVDGFETLIGTCSNNYDSNGNGLSDGQEVLGYPRTDPFNGNCSSASTTSNPWRQNATGTQYINIGWDYAMGYHFTPLLNGTIDQLGGFFNGVKQVKLFNRTTGALLAQTTVSAANNWNYSSIPPVNVQANQSYTVAVYLAGSGGSYRTFSPIFPLTVDSNFRIDSSTHISTAGQPNAIPTNITNTKYSRKINLTFLKNYKFSEI